MDLDLTRAAPPSTAPATTPPGASPPAHHAKTAGRPLPSRNPTWLGHHSAATSMAEGSRRHHPPAPTPRPPSPLCSLPRLAPPRYRSTALPAMRRRPPPRSAPPATPPPRQTRRRPAPREGVRQGCRQHPPPSMAGRRRRQRPGGEDLAAFCARASGASGAAPACDPGGSFLLFPRSINTTPPV